MRQKRIVSLRLLEESSVIRKSRNMMLMTDKICILPNWKNILSRISILTLSSCDLVIGMNQVETDKIILSLVLSTWLIPMGNDGNEMLSDVQSVENCQKRTLIIIIMGIVLPTPSHNPSKRQLYRLLKIFNSDWNENVPPPVIRESPYQTLPPSSFRF